MITFQAIIDEARRQKNKLALDFYNLLKEIQVEHDNYRFDLVASFEDEGSETVVSFDVDTWVENASYFENNIKLAIMDIEDFDEEHKLSFTNVLTSLEEQLDDFEEALQKESFDQAENGHAEDGITFTSYVWHSKEERDALEDQIESLVEIYDDPEELEKGVKKAIDKYIKKQKVKNK